MEDILIDGKMYKPWQFKPGWKGGPGRPPGKSLKEYSREYLASLTDEERIEFMAGLDKIDIWKMAEGNPHQSGDTKVEFNPTPLLDGLRNNNSNKEDSKPQEEN